ncbi:hypothetical protein Tco_0339091 [Tanacetum coccineum]
MMYCFINNIHVDYAKLLWEGLYYSLHHPTSSIPKQKDKVGMQIPDWMITKDEAHGALQENDESNIPDTRLEPRSDKERSKERSTNEKSVEITNVVILVNVNEEEDEITDEVYELKRREKGKIVEESRSTTPFPSHHVRDQVPVYVAEGLIMERQKTKEEMERMITKAILQERGNIQAEISSKFRKQLIITFLSKNPQLQQQDLAIWLALQMKFENLQKRIFGESSSGQVNKRNESISTSRNQEQEDDYDFWTESYASDDDEIPTKQMLQDIMEEVSLTIDEAKLKKMANEMLRQRCTSGDEHQYHINQMKNFLKSDIVWESRKEIPVSPHPQKTTPLVQSCQRDPEAPTLSLINQDLLYLKKGSLGPEKIVLSLHKFPVIIFNDNDIEEQTSRWVNKCVKKFNPYARYGVEHWKNPHAKIFYIRKQKDLGKPKEVIYSNSMIIQVIKTYWELGHEHKFIIEIVARRANECIVSITEPDYKNLNKNDIEDMYLLIMNGKVPDYAETGLLWSLSVFIRSSVIWERVHDFQLGI